jgi:ureidoglycolate hydrolase
MPDSVSSTRRVVTVPVQPLTPLAFAPYGTVVTESQTVLASTEFPFFTNVATLLPLSDEMTYINRHHDHNQIFATFGGEPMVVIVARPEISATEFDPSQIEAFVTNGNTAIVFNIDTWHIAPRALGPRPIQALNVQATNNRVHTERIEFADVGYVVKLAIG